MPRDIALALSFNVKDKARTVQDYFSISLPQTLQLQVTLFPSALLLSQDPTGRDGARIILRFDYSLTL